MVMHLRLVDGDQPSSRSVLYSSKGPVVHGRLKWEEREFTMQIKEAHLKLTKSESLGQAQSLHFHELPKWLLGTVTFEKLCFEVVDQWCVTLTLRNNLESLKYRKEGWD